MKTRIVSAFEEAAAGSSTRERGSVSAFVALVACDVILLLMLAA